MKCSSWCRNFQIIFIILHVRLMHILQERIKQRSMKVADKTTHASRINFRTAQMIRPADSDEEGKQSEDEKAVVVKDDPLAVTKGKEKHRYESV